MIFKLLIVDDEATMRKGIAEYMNWDAIDCEVVGTACDGMEAISFLQEHDVDIIITDIRMPEVDGLAVAKYVYESHHNQKVILLTGYADFEYAKTAIKYNVTAFILKPTNKKELFEAVQSAQSQLITSKQYTNIAKEELAFLKEQFLQDLTNQPYISQLLPKLQQYNISLENYYIVAFRLIPFSNEIASLKKIIIDEKKRNAYCYRYNNLIITIYYFDDLNIILQNCREITSITRTLDSRDIAIGISNHHSTPAEFSQAVSEAIYALSLNFYSENNISLFSDAKNNNYDLTVENSLDLFQFENYLLNWQYKEAENNLNNIFTKFKSNLVNAQDAKNICSQIYYICSRIAIKKDFPPLPSEYLGKINSASDIFALESSLLDILRYIRSYSDTAANTQKQLISQAMKYIDENISSELSLDTIANHLHISPSHLSRTFKKATNHSLTDYINHARIKKAKELLKHTDIYTYTIAEMAGYNDATYFSSIFKKYEGVSPSEYRIRNSI